MDADVEEAFWHIFENIITSIKEEYQLLEGILLDDEGWEQNEALIPALDVYEGLENALDAVVGRFLEIEMLEMEAVDEEDMLEFIYERNDRLIDWRAQLPRMEHLRSIEDLTFSTHFRMDRETVEGIVCAVTSHFFRQRLVVMVIGNHLTERGRLSRLRTEIDKCVLMALWIMANLATFRETGTAFGVSRGTVHFHYLVIIEALRERAPIYIKWPSQPRLERIKRTIEERTGYPGIVGMIDGTLIRTTAPAIQRERYFDRHQSYSMNVQAVCDDKLLFRDVYVGQPGSVHDIRVFERSPLHDMLLETQDVVGDDEYIIGDGGYECTKQLLVPYRDNGNMTLRQRIFNYVHSSTRMYIERAFGRLKGKFRRLQKLYVKRFVYDLDHIIASFVLHNFVILRGEEADGICVMNAEVNEQANEQELEDPEDALMGGHEGGERGGNRAGAEHPLLAQSKAAGPRKREVIADELFRSVN